MTDSSKKRLKAQPKDMIFALDIGTRSIIGIVGTVEGEKLRVLAVEKEEHTQRSMIDGQIEDIEQVAKIARIVTNRLEGKLRCRLKRVCVAAAGRALRTQRASYQMEFPQTQRLDEETISRLEAGAIGEAEAAFNDEPDLDNRRQFYLVGHTVVQYYMDRYPISSLLDHQARMIQADVIATFLPSEVVESLYSAMHRIDLEVASLTLEPIAAINAVIPKNLRLLNLALVDIGAGTSDIAVSRDGGVVGYTMVTVAGDEMTEALMKNYLLDFNTAESVKTQLGSQESINVTNILGMEQIITKEGMMNCIEEPTANLCREIAEHICEVNGAPTAAVFLAGGGSKLGSIRTGIAKYMNLDENRVAIAGNNFQIYAFSDAYDLNDPEYATPLGIAVSAGLNLINDSFHVTLNGSRAKLFRNSTMSVLDILMMNGFSYQELLPRSGQKLIIQLNGKHTVYYGTPGEPAVLMINGQEAKISDLVHMGDSIEFSPAVHGLPARRCLKDLLENRLYQTAKVNGKITSPDTPLRTGDIILVEWEEPVQDKISSSSIAEEAQEITPPPSVPEPIPEHPESATPVQPAVLPESGVPLSVAGSVQFILNHQTITLSKKTDGSPFYLMDMLELSGIDLEHPTGDVILRVNGTDSSFLQELTPGDHLEIGYKS